MSIQIRAITPSEFPAFEAAGMRVFGGDAPSGESRLANVLEAERTYAAFDGSEIVATAGAFTLELAVPGAVLPMAGLTFVAVSPTHRRRGILRALMERHEEDMRKHGEILSGLWASESRIYGRFGYGVAAEAQVLHFDTRQIGAQSSAECDPISFCPPEEAQERISGLYEDLLRKRPGLYRRTDAWWKHRRLYDAPEKRGGTSSMRIALAIRDGKTVGYALYRQSLQIEDANLEGKVKLVELLGLDTRAEASLWQFVTNLDLYQHVHYWNAPVDCPLPWLVSDRRRVHRRTTDTLWLRIEDPAKALECRTYRATGDLPITLTEETRSTHLRLSADAARVTCVEHSPLPGITLAKQDLSALYLGAFRASELATAGRLQGAPEHIALADAMFGTSRAPWCPEIF